MKRTSVFLVPFALGVMGTLSLILLGCERTPESTSPVAPAADSPMKDPAFRGQLKELDAARAGLLKARATVIEQMKAKVDAVRSRLKTEDEKAIKAELEKDPEWQSLYKRCTDANVALGEQRQKTLDVVRERLTSKKQISK